MTMNTRRSFLLALAVGTSSMFTAGTINSSFAVDDMLSGSDMWTGIMVKNGLFTPHEDDCITGETFISLHTDEYGVAQGFCIDNNEDSGGAKTWTEARSACLAISKRLPEPGEFKHVCLNVGGVSNLTDDYEWTSNFSQNTAIDDTNGRQGVASPAMGNGSCSKATAGWAASSDGSESTLAFRCVR